MASNRNHPIAIIFRGLRKEAGFTQVRLEAEINICIKKISAIENGDEEFISNFTLDEMELWKTTCQEFARTSRREETADKWASKLLEYFTKKFA